MNSDDDAAHTRFTHLAGKRLIEKTAKQLRRKAEWRNAIVRTLVRISNRYGALPAGAYWLVERSHGGLDLLSLPCRCCGFQLRITKVSERDTTYIGHLTTEGGTVLQDYPARDLIEGWRVNGAETARPEQ